MSLVKWTNRPLVPLVNSVFDDFFSNNQDWRLPIERSNTPAANVAETESDFTIELAVPGKQKEDFKIEIDSNVIAISSEEESSTETEEKNYTRKEYSYQSFCRSFTLPENANAENISAEYAEGVLKVVIPKNESVETKKMTIQVS